MLKKLDDIKKRYEFLSEQLADANVIADMGTWQKYSKEQSDLTETVEKYEEYLACEQEMSDALMWLKYFIASAPASRAISWICVMYSITNAPSVQSSLTCPISSVTEAIPCESR